MKNSRGNIFLFALLMLIVFIRGALRSYTVGNDTEAYLNIYEAISAKDMFVEVILSGLISTIELGYMTLNWICGKLFAHNQSILIVSCIIIYCGYYKFLRKYSSALLLSFVLFFFLRYSDEAMNIIRQSIAMVLVLKSYDFIKKRKFINFVCLILFTSLIHKSVIVFLPAWWICNIEYTKRNVLLGVCASVTIMFLIRYASSIVFSLMGGYSTYMSDEYDYAAAGKIAPLINTVMYAVFLIFVNRRLRSAHNHADPALLEDMSRMRNLLFVGVCVLIVSLSNALIFRMSLYYNVFVIALIPNAVSLSRNRSSWSIIITLCLILYYFVIILYRPDWNMVYPYSFFWQNPFVL